MTSISEKKVSAELRLIHAEQVSLYYFIVLRKTVSGKLPPGKFPPIKLPYGKFPPAKIPNQKIPTWNIPTLAFKYSHTSF